jgi:hypothetical protein
VGGQDSGGARRSGQEGRRAEAGETAEGAVWDTDECVGAWRSLVARTVRVGEVPGSNPGAPMKTLGYMMEDWLRCVDLRRVSLPHPP